MIRLEIPDILLALACVSPPHTYITFFIKKVQADLDATLYAGSGMMRPDKPLQSAALFNATLHAGVCMTRTMCHNPWCHTLYAGTHCTQAHTVRTDATTLDATHCTH